MSGRGRKQPNRAKARHSQPASKKGAPPGRSPRAAAASSATPPAGPQNPARSAPAARPARSGPASGGGQRRPSRPSAEAGRYARAARRKRNQRIGVLIGALALAGALVGSVLLGQRGGSTAQAQNAGATSTSASPPSHTAPTTASASTSPSASSPAVRPMAITCPTGGGATTLFGHEITVPEPYTVAITYGDGDEYSNDSAHLGAIFSHTYKEAGTYAVNAVLTAPNGETASANCTYTWGP